MKGGGPTWRVKLHILVKKERGRIKCKLRVMYGSLEGVYWREQRRKTGGKTGGKTRRVE